ncbi:MAG: VCBS repeat-containing protein, partial [Verrucomicrobiae bacterium]|nr:VCBS repeat-containing protein [Verrucomicrobiae bacterium]
FTKAIDYGVMKLSLNGQPLGEPMDFFNRGVIGTGEIDLGEAQLAAGENRLTVEVVGANDNAVKAYMFGLDYVKLEPK